MHDSLHFVFRFGYSLQVSVKICIVLDKILCIDYGLTYENMAIQPDLRQSVHEDF